MTLTLGIEAPTLDALGLALLHFLWQGALLALGLAAANTLLRRGVPSLRYLLAGATLLLMLATPVLTFVALRAQAAASPATRSAVPRGAALQADADAGRRGTTPALMSGPRLQGAMPALVAGWLCGVVLLSLRSAREWIRAQRLRGSGLCGRIQVLDEALDRLRLKLGVSRAVRLIESALVEVPTVVGWIRPVILFPASALTGLHPLQVEVILAHELAHVRRMDYLVNLLQDAVETLLFYHPGVWWVSHRMRVEREHCCDDLAVAACGNALGYARALADLEGLRAEPRLALAVTGGSLLERIARLLGAPLPEGSRSGRWIAAIAALGAVGLSLGLGPSLKAGPRWRSTPVVAATPTTASFQRVRVVTATLAAPEAAPRTPAVASAETKALPLQTILELAGAGVTPEYIDEMEAAGYPDLAPQALLEARNQGVDGDMVKELAAQGLSGLSLSELINLRSQGVDGEYIAGLKKAGVDGLSPSRLIELRSQGVDPDDVEAFRKLGYQNLSVSRLIVLRNQGVNADYVKEMRDVGYPNLSVPVLLALRQQGVDADFVKELKGEGLTDLPTGGLIELRQHGVDAEFVREMKQAGMGTASPEELIQLRDHGVSGELIARLRRSR